jgi:hypothetical protein
MTQFDWSSLGKFLLIFASILAFVGMLLVALAKNRTIQNS